MDERIDFSKLRWGAELKFPSTRHLAETPHFIGGKYPCRSVAYLPRKILEWQAVNKRCKTILDPFMGSGTTAIEAARVAENVYGLEVDTYARLVASIAARKYNRRHKTLFLNTLENIVAKYPSYAKKPASHLEPSLANIHYWFTKRNYTQLLQLKTALFDLAPNKTTRDFFLVVFGHIIRSCSKAERQSLKPYISTKYPNIPRSPLPEFEKTARKYIEALNFTDQNRAKGITWLKGDATSFNCRNLDVAITSPPYINAMDYIRCIKLESAWIGTGNDEILSEIRALQLGEIGRYNNTSEKLDPVIANNRKLKKLKSIDEKKFNLVCAYFDDMNSNLRCVFDALKANGRYFIIIGDSVIRGVNIPTHKIIANLAETVGFAWENYFYYKIKDHRTSIPRGQRGGKIQHEHVLMLTK